MRAELVEHGVEVLTGTTVKAVSREADGRLRVEAASADGESVTRLVDLVLVVVGVRPDTAPAAEAGAELGLRGAIAADEWMRASLPGAYAAGDCVVTHHRLLARPGCRWAPPRTSRGGWRARTRSAVTGASPGAWARRW
ncbi:FAD-dependent oxidoreductase [Streptomyces sp. NPDC093568]|uniref:FAD-dependent oxidoreductase n=1 Tax=Streptomyces sp. NPDC093568 TaxID=3366041 RepID=UPI00381BBB07